MFLSCISTNVLTRSGGSTPPITPPLSPIHVPHMPQAQEKPLRGNAQVMTPLTLEDTLTFTFLANIKERTLVNVPPPIQKISVNIRSFPVSHMHQYAVVIVATPSEEQEYLLFQKQFALNLVMSLAPGGTPIMRNQSPFKVIVWNYRGANKPTFKRNVLDIISSHNPVVLALTETRMTDHDSLLQLLSFFDVIQVPALGCSGGIALF